ncbi:hypothetical protein ScalyP_jg7193 [Parmales sp. scaly parma]|nr:hypothetical protein ScalyP_jg7193 [Parmales sp. scaly parma]
MQNDLTSTPAWINGVWSRNWIKRRDGPKPGDDSVSVKYVQAGSYFVDVRSPPNKGGKKGVMAFAGFTTVEKNLVRWHTLIEKDVQTVAHDWGSVLLGRPNKTEDEGYYTMKDLETKLWSETSLDGDLEEEWVKLGEGGEGSGAWIYANSSIFVIAGDWFGLACERDGAFCTGRTSDWVIISSASDTKNNKKGGKVVLLGFPSEWTQMTGTLKTLPVEIFHNDATMKVKKGGKKRKMTSESHSQMSNENDSECDSDDLCWWKNSERESKNLAQYVQQWSTPPTPPTKVPTRDEIVSFQKRDKILQTRLDIEEKKLNLAKRERGEVRGGFGALKWADGQAKCAKITLTITAVENEIVSISNFLNIL